MIDTLTNYFIKSFITRLAFILFLITLSLNSFGQLYNFTNYTIEQGLPQSTVFCVTHDSQGYLWLGTESGAARFNGKYFEVFDRTNSLPGNTVRSIVEDANGSIWFGTDKGIAIYNGLSWKILNETQGLRGSTITKLLADKQGRMWAATNDAGVNVISTINDSLSIQNISDRQGLSANFVLDMMLDSNDEMWLAMIGGLFTVSVSETEVNIKNIADSVNLPSSYISCIDKDKAGNIWIGTLNAGAFKWDRETGNMQSFSYPGGITDERIWDILYDEDGSVWFASEKSGVYRFKNQVVQNISSANGLVGNQVFCLHRDNNRNLWLGMVGQGLNMFQGFQLVHYTINDGLPGSSVMAVKSDEKGTLWIGANGQGLARATVKSDRLEALVFSSSQNYKTSDVTSIDFDNAGDLIAGTRGEGLLRYKNNSISYLTQSDGLINNNINCVYSTPLGAIYVGSDNGFNEIAGQKIYTISEEQGLINSEVQTVVSDGEKNIWMGTLGGLVRFQAKTSQYRDFNEEEGLFDLGIHALAVDQNNNIWIGTNNGIYTYNPVLDTIVAFTKVVLNSRTINSLLFFNDSTLVVGTVKGFNKISFDSDIQKVKKLNVYDNSNGFKYSETNFNAICTDANKHIWFGTVNGLTAYRPEKEDTINELPLIHITDIRLSFEKIDWESRGLDKSAWRSYPKKLKLPHDENHITFDYEGIYLKNPEKVMFKYKLEPNEKLWSPATKNTSVTYSGLSNNEYSFSLIASSNGVDWSEPISYDFLTIRPPFWKTLWFGILVFIVISALIVAYISWREKKLVKEKEHLEKVVKERTAEVVAQKDEIENQKDEITNSINYAERIQRAILPGIENLQINTDDSFILFKPCHIVSGDYYWIERLGRQLVVVAADCTGHGVPGAFMSMLGVSFLNKIVNEKKINAPDVILGQMRSNVISSLKQGDYAGSSKDGMDMALCVLDIDTLEMNFSGAYNPAIVISNGEANELNADRMPVGYHIKMDDFTSTKIQLKKGDCIYMYSDGFQDQIGGPRERKFMRKKMRELLVEIHKKPFIEQHDILKNTIEDWMNHPVGKTDQMDDILIVGFRV